MEYLTFIRSLDDLPENKPVELVVKDLTQGTHKYEARCVSAKLSRSAIKGGDKLWVRFDKGLLHPEPFGMKIVKELGPYPSKDFYKAGWLNY
jgi:hypothetical protein